MAKKKRGRPRKIAPEVQRSRAKTPGDIMEAMAATFKERNAIYGDNYKVVGDVMAVLFPGGVTLNTPSDFVRWHLLELQVVKMTRLANSGITHLDSIHDIAVYGAMLEAVTPPHAMKIGRNES